MGLFDRFFKPRRTIIRTTEPPKRKRHRRTRAELAKARLAEMKAEVELAKGQRELERALQGAQERAQRVPRPDRVQGLRVGQRPARGAHPLRAV